MEDNLKFKDTNSTKKIFSLKKRIRAVTGGTSASKTISILVWHIDYAQSNTAKKMDIFAESYPHLKNGAIKDFKSIMMAQGYWDDRRWNSTEKTYTFETNTTLNFLAVDKLGKAKGGRRDTGFVNEAQHAMSWEIFDQLLVRTKEVMWLDWNPSEEFWYDEKIKGIRDHDFLRLTYLDCLDALDKNIIEDIESHKGNANWWNIYGLGLHGAIEGRIYTDWKLIDEIPHEARLERRGLDFGYSIDPTVLEDIYTYNGGFIIDEQIYQKGLSNRAIYQMIQNLPEPETLVIADSAEPKSIDELKDFGLNVIGATKGPGSVLQGIQFVQDQKISVTKRSLKTIKAYRNYMWTKDKATGKFILVPDDSVHEWSNPHDAIRYGLSSYKPHKKIIYNQEEVEPRFNDIGI